MSNLCFGISRYRMAVQSIHTILRIAGSLRGTLLVATRRYGSFIVIDFFSGDTVF